MPTSVKKIGPLPAFQTPGNSVEETLVNAPATTIINRAKVSNSLKPIMGNERIRVNSLRLVSDEFGPNGEPVYTSDKEDSRIRFVGSSWNTIFSTNGTSAVQEDVDDYIEVTFYGTGLNMLTLVDSGARDFRVSVDGGAEGSNIYSVSSNVLNSRNYNHNQILPIVSGLSLGFHTVKIRNNSAFTYSIWCYGFEILNENSQIVVPEGTCFSKGEKIEVDAALLDYNLGFENVADIDVGTNGGRVVIAVDKEDGVVKKWLTKVDAAPAYLLATDHSNEAIYRKINFREFGRNRGDDFSTLSAQDDVAFTLDDGTTTLAAPDALAADNYFVSANGAFFTITFVGTGLDLVHGNASPQADSPDVFIDGVSVGKFADFADFRDKKIIKVCSGLPYGTHTVKISRTTSNQGIHISDFIIYQPKKPTLPAGAVELAQYNIMADYSDYVWANDTTPISSGVLRKQNTREFIYAGTDWAVNENAAGLDVGGKDLFTGTNLGSGQYAETTFFGTGFVLRFRATAIRCPDTTVTLDGSSDFSSIDTTLISGVAGTSWTPATGLLDQNVTSGDDKGVGLVVKGLPLGLHTVRITKNVTTGQLVIGAFDIITPIHSPNTSIGSLGISDERNRKFEDEYIFRSNQNQNDTTVDYSKGISQVLDIGTGFVDIFFEDAMIEIPYVDGQGSADVVRISGDPNTFRYRIAVENPPGTNNDARTITFGIGKRQKDVFKD